MTELGTEGSRHRSFILRCWQESGTETGIPCWRFSLEESGERGTRKGFAAIERLFAYLTAQLDGASTGDHAGPERGTEGGQIGDLSSVLR